MSRWMLYSLLLLLMVIWGFNVSAIKIIVENFPPVFIQSVRILMAGIVVIGYLLISRNFKKVSKKNIRGIIIISLFGVVGHHLCLALGLTSTTATNAGLILGLIPLVTSILAMIFLGEVLTKTKFIGIILAFLGIYFIVANGKDSLTGLSIGDLYILGAVITQAISFILIKKLTSNIDSRQLTGMMLVFGSIIILILSFFVEKEDVLKIHSPNEPILVWSVLIASAIFATALGHMLYNYAIHRLGAGSTAIFINLTPFFSLVGSALLLGEKIYFEQIIGFIFIIFGVILGTGTIESYFIRRKIKSGLD